MRTFLDKLQSLSEKIRFFMASLILVILAIAIFYAWSNKTSADLFKISDTVEPTPAAFLNTLTPPDSYSPETRSLAGPVGLLPQIKNGLKDIISLILGGIEGLFKKINP